MTTFGTYRIFVGKKTHQQLGNLKFGTSVGSTYVRTNGSRIYFWTLGQYREYGEKQKQKTKKQISLQGKSARGFQISSPPHPASLGLRGRSGVCVCVRVPAYPDRLQSGARRM